MSKGEQDRAARLWVTGTSSMAYRQQGYLAEETSRNSEFSAENCTGDSGDAWERGKKVVVMSCSQMTRQLLVLEAIKSCATAFPNDSLHCCRLFVQNRELKGASWVNRASPPLFHMPYCLIQFINWSQKVLSSFSRLESCYWTSLFIVLYTFGRWQGCPTFEQCCWYLPNIYF